MTDARHVLVVGAGPAGLAAAESALAAGARVTLLDSSDELGGQYWRHLPSARLAAHEERLHHGWQGFVRRRSVLAQHPDCTIVTEAQVWALETGDAAAASPVTVHVLIGPPDGTDREPQTYRPDALVLATGAHDRTLPFPGWQLPGVYSAGAAQALAKGERVSIGDRVVIAGAGPFLLPVAKSLTQTGARVVGVFEASTPARLLRGWSSKPLELLGARGKAPELVEYALGHLRHRIPYRTGWAVVEAHGTDRVESVTIQKVDASWAPIPGTRRRIAADAVAVSHGFTPRLELAIAAGCDITPDRFVRVDDLGRTSVPGVFAAGEITSIGGADAALAEGSVAGHVAAGGDPADVSLRADRRRRRTFTAFAARLERAHGIRAGWTGWLRDDTIACRCEEVSCGTIRSTVRRTAQTGVRSVKLTTRAGLGICQARICGRTVEELIRTAEHDAAPATPSASANGSVSRTVSTTASAKRPTVTPDASLSAPGDSGTDPVRPPVSTDRRPIVSPVRLGELAGLAASARPSLGAADLGGSTDDRDAAVVSAAPDLLDPPDLPDLPDARPARSAED
jgi:NADPH-dependent 2,4-dienoyl-CoA reductase/sulfur reductase-like enzyme